MKCKARESVRLSKSVKMSNMGEFRAEVNVIQEKKECGAVQSRVEGFFFI